MSKDASELLDESSLWRRVLHEPDETKRSMYERRLSCAMGQEKKGTSEMSENKNTESSVEQAVQNTLASADEAAHAATLMRINAQMFEETIRVLGDVNKKLLEKNVQLEADINALRKELGEEVTQDGKRWTYVAQYGDGILVTGSRDKCLAFIAKELNFQIAKFGNRTGTFQLLRIEKI